MVSLTGKSYIIYPVNDWHSVRLDNESGVPAAGIGKEALGKSSMTWPLSLFLSSLDEETGHIHLLQCQKIELFPVSRLCLSRFASHCIPASHSSLPSLLPSLRLLPHLSQIQDSPLLTESFTPLLILRHLIAASSSPCPRPAINQQSQTKQCTECRLCRGRRRGKDLVNQTQGN